MSKRSVIKINGIARRSARNRYVIKRNNLHINHNRARLSVFRSNRHIYAQIITDSIGKTLASASTLEMNDASCKKCATRDTAAEVGKRVAERAIKVGITRITFDRGAYQYHGQISALADGAREGGLEF